MKHYLLLLLLCTAFSFQGFACGPFDRNSLAKEYYLFRACGEDMTGMNQSLNKERARANCQAWANLTSSDIPFDDIYDIVYHWTRNSMNIIHWELTTSKYTLCANRFERWIVNNRDLEVLEFLKLAKECEEIRAKQNSVWYYPVDGDVHRNGLEEIIDQSISYSGKRLRDRYTLQAIRALFSLQQYGDCINLWLERESEFPDGVIKDMMVDYIAGCYIRLKQPAKASQLYLHHGDPKVAVLNGLVKKNRFDTVYKLDPDNTWLIAYMQRKIHEIEPYDSKVWDAEIAVRKYTQLYAKVIKVCNERRCHDMAPWYYTRAFLADKLNKAYEAKAFIAKAEKSVRSKELSNAIRVLKLHIHTKYASTYNLEFEASLFNELQWLDQMIVTNLGSSTRNCIVSDGVIKHLYGESQYYWSDVLRKILIGNVVPLCLKSNFEARALEYLNYADNRIFNLVGDIAIWVPNPNKSEEEYYDSYIQKVISWEEYRSREDVYNSYDYRNDFFITMDSLGVEPIQQMMKHYQHPQCPLDRFLLQRSYTDMQFFNDIVGTQLLAAMKYSDAVDYLSEVSAKFNRSRNVFARCNVDPFTGKKLEKPEDFYRLNFAKRMASLEQQIANAKDVNEKASFMLTYAHGLQHSIDQKGWVLTTFYRGEFYDYPYYSSYQRHLTDSIADRASGIIEKALKMFTDREMAAKAYYDWKRFKTVVDNFPETETASFIQGHCDQLRDYLVYPKTWL